MFKPTNKLVKQLQTFGLSVEEARIYLYTSKYGASTALNISKDLHIDRAKVYRLLDKLREKKLVSQQMGERGLVFVAEEPSQLNILITEKETELTKIKSSFALLQEELEEISKEKSDESKVLYYKGKEGLQQVTWNSLKADKKLRIMEISSDMSKFLDSEYSEEVRKEFVERRIHIYQLTNLTEISEYTKVKELVDKYWDVRYIDPTYLKIDFETLIYNETVAMYSTRGKNVFCVEIYDKRLAQMQKQLFDFVWSQSKKMNVVNAKGRAVLE